MIEPMLSPGSTSSHSSVLRLSIGMNTGSTNDMSKFDIVDTRISCSPRLYLSLSDGACNFRVDIHSFFFWPTRAEKI